jgi:hypothetical protein
MATPEHLVSQQDQTSQHQQQATHPPKNKAWCTSRGAGRISSRRHVVDAAVLTLLESAVTDTSAAGRGFAEQNRAERERGWSSFLSFVGLRPIWIFGASLSRQQR